MLMDTTFPAGHKNSVGKAEGDEGRYRMDDDQFCSNLANRVYKYSTYLTLPPLPGSELRGLQITKHAFLWLSAPGNRRF